MAVAPVWLNGNFSGFNPRKPRAYHKLPMGNRKIQVRLMRRVIQSRFLLKDWYIWNKAATFALSYGMGPQSIARALNLEST